MFPMKDVLRVLSIGMIVLTGCLFGDPGTARAQACGVGTRVETDQSGTEGHVGTITEIGSEAPHIGWYRIAYEWNQRSDPKGNWVNPKNYTIRIAGTNTRCSAGGSRSAPAVPPLGRTTANRAPAVGTDDCPMNVPAGRVAKTSAASAALFQRVIYERMAAKVGGTSISAPKQIGLTFEVFQLGGAYKNSLSGNRVDRRLHDGAPVGASIYPIKTRYVKCELYDRSISRMVIEQNFACFKDKFGEWVCPTDSTPKFLEQGSVPVR